MADSTPSELMTVIASRQLTSDDVCFVGIGAPSAACNLARMTHAPGVTLIYESGTLGARPTVLPLSIGDGELARTAVTNVSVPEMFQYWLQGGHISVGFLGAAQLDRFGNLNTTVIGAYDRPKVRLPGGGGAPEIATHCQRTLITMKHTRRGFVEKLDFVTSLGFGPTGTEREGLEVRTRGPVLVITDLAVLAPDPQTRELTVVSMHPDVTREQVTAATGWPVRFSSTLTVTKPPTTEELQLLRDLHRRTAEAHAASPTARVGAGG